MRKLSIGYCFTNLTPLKSVNNKTIIINNKYYLVYIRYHTKCIIIQATKSFTKLKWIQKPTVLLKKKISGSTLVWYFKKDLQYLEWICFGEKENKGRP